VADRAPPQHWDVRRRVMRRDHEVGNFIRIVRCAFNCSFIDSILY
jgi:hypothetical protein